MKNLTILFSSFMMASALANTSVTSGNSLGLKLGLEVSKEMKEKNFMISPLSLQQALSIAANGAASQTKRDLEGLMGATITEINNDSVALVSYLNFSPEDKKEYMEKYPYSPVPSVISVENSLWQTNGKSDGRHYDFSSRFKDVSSKYYNAEVQSLDFVNPESHKSINKWAEEKTYGLIKEIIDAATLKDLLWVIMNASYVEANWAKPFTLMNLDAPKFTLLNRTQVEAKMITSRQNISYSELNDGSKLASIPFTSNGESAALEFVVYLPGEAENFAIAKKRFFSQKFFEKAIKTLHRTENTKKVQVVLPKFSFDTSVLMKKDEDLTKNMGLNFLFQNSADFSLMATEVSAPSIIGIIKQNSRIELDEKGVKAAAVTIIGGIERTSIELEPKSKFIVDRPFMFAIVERASNALLFTGAVVNPL